MPESLISPGAVLGAAEATAALGVSGYGGVAFQIQGTFSGTITFEASLGSEWVAMRVTPSNSSTPVTTATTTGVYIGSAVGFSAVRARMSAYSSGGAHVLIRSDLASPGGSSSGGGAGSDVNLIEVGGVSVALGETTMSASIPVVIASDQTPIPITGSISATNPSVSATGAAVPADATYVGILDPSGNLQGLAAETFDYDTGGGTALVTAVGIALPASGGPVAGGTSTNPLRTDPTGTTTQPVSAASLPLPTGASTSANQTSGNSTLTTMDGRLAVMQTVVGSKAPGTAALAANLVGGLYNATPPTLTDGQQAAVQLSSAGRLLTDTAVASVAGNVTVVQPTAANLNATVNLSQVGGTNVVSGGTNGTQAVGGIQAHDAADSGNNPVKTGGKATSAEPTAVSSGDIANFITDLVGKQIVLPYANPENFVSGVISSAMTGTTSTSLIAAPASGLRNYITQITVSNTHATVGTNMELQDGNGGTTFYIIPAAAVYGGATLSFPTPLRQPTTATAVYIKNTTTGASTFASASGYKGA